MKILYLTKGVVGKHGYYRDIQLAKGLVKLGHDVTLVAAAESWRGSCQDVVGVKVQTFFDFLPYQIKKGGLSFLDVLSRLVFLIGKKFDVVFVDSGFRPVTGIPGHLYAWWANVPYVCEWWDWLGKGGLYERKSKKYQYTLGVLDNYFEIVDKKAADGVVPLSQKLKQRALNLDIPDERLLVLHGGADLSLSGAPTKAEARQLLGLPVDAQIVGFAGMDHGEVEDLRPFLEAIHELKLKHSNFIWFSTGGRLPDVFRNYYEIGKEYHEFGWVDYDQYRNCLACADVLLLFQEDHLINQARWPNKLGDYMAVGRPVLTTSVGEVETFASGFEQHGLYLTAWNKEAVIASLDELLGNPDKMNEMGQKNAEIARNAFSWERKSEELGVFLEKIISMGKRR